MLGDRRRALLPSAPLFWRPSEHAARYHRAFLNKLLAREAAAGYRTETAVLIAADQAHGWDVDDAHVANGRWVASPDADALWAAFAGEHRGDPVRMVCPVYERERTDFAVGNGLILANTWWLLELPGSEGGTANEHIEVPGAAAFTTGAPPVYAPPGPMLFLSEVTDPRLAISVAVDEAPRRGCAGIVVDHHPTDDALESALRAGGFRAHCAYYTGAL